MKYVYERLVSNLNRLTNTELERLLHRVRAELIFRDAILFDVPICDYTVLSSPAWVSAEWDVIRLHDRSVVR